jgi:hypothetical protein
VHHADATDEHLGDIIASADPHLPDQGQNQGMPFGGQDVFHVARVQGGCDIRQVLEFGGGDAVEDRITIRQGFQPVQLIDNEIKMLARCLSRSA